MFALLMPILSIDKLEGLGSFACLTPCCFALHHEFDGVDVLALHTPKGVVGVNATFLHASTWYLLLPPAEGITLSLPW